MTAIRAYLVRLSVLAAALFSAASAAAAAEHTHPQGPRYFPIESDTLLLLNLGLLMTAGAIAGYKATTFEGDGLLSNVLCNRPRKGKLSISLFVFVAAPFLALSGAIAVTRIPGVVDWSGGVIGLLLGLGLHP